MRKTFLILAFAGAVSAAEPAVDAAAAFARLKALKGEWTGEGGYGKAKLVYEVIAGGSSVVERESAERLPEMMTVFHLDGKRLILTHYCIAGNQPRMVAAEFDETTKELRFRFFDATNMKSPDAGHMRDVNIRFVDETHLVTEWHFHENGQLKKTEKAAYTKVR
jgi:hypothetical protein